MVEPGLDLRSDLLYNISSSIAEAPPSAFRNPEGSAEGSMDLSTFQGSNLQNCVTINVCCLKPPSLWSFVQRDSEFQCLGL